MSSERRDGDDVMRVILMRDSNNKDSARYLETTPPLHQQLVELASARFCTNQICRLPRNATFWLPIGPNQAAYQASEGDGSVIIMIMIKDLLDHRSRCDRRVSGASSNLSLCVATHGHDVVDSPSVTALVGDNQPPPLMCRIPHRHVEVSYP